MIIISELFFGKDENQKKELQEQNEHPEEEVKRKRLDK